MASDRSAEYPSSTPSVVRNTSEKTRMRNGIPKANSRARAATLGEAHTTTCCPGWYLLASLLTTSTIFSLASEALQCAATLQAPQAEVCRIRTFTFLPSTLSTMPECSILLFIDCFNTDCNSFALQRYEKKAKVDVYLYIFFKKQS